MKLTISTLIITHLLINKSTAIGLNPLKSAQDQLDSTIGAAKSQLDDNLAVAKNKIDRIAAGLTETAESAGQVVYDQIRGILDKFDGQLKDLEKSSGKNVQDCMALANSKDSMALEVMVNVSTCIVDQLEIGDGIPESLFQLTGNVRKNLTSIQQEAQSCFQDVRLTAIPKATACAAKMTAKAGWISANSIPSTITTTAGLTNQMEKLSQNIPGCASNTGIERLPIKYGELYLQVKNCVDKK